MQQQTQKLRISKQGSDGGWGKQWQCDGSSWGQGSEYKRWRRATWAEEDWRANGAQSVAGARRQEAQREKGDEKTQETGSRWVPDQEGDKGAARHTNRTERDEGDFEQRSPERSSSANETDEAETLDFRRRWHLGKEAWNRLVDLSCEARRRVMKQFKPYRPSGDGTIRFITFVEGFERISKEAEKSAVESQLVA